MIFTIPELLLDPHLEAVRALADLCHLDRVPLATSLLRVFRLGRVLLSFVNAISVSILSNSYF